MAGLSFDLGKGEMVALISHNGADMSGGCALPKISPHLRALT